MIRPAWPAVVLVPAVLDLISDAANNLAWRGHIEYDDDIPRDVVSELVALAAEGRCSSCFCRAWLRPDSLADHWLARKQDEYERSIPTWACDCGKVYKVIAEMGDRDTFWHAIHDAPEGPLCPAASDPASGDDCPHDSCAEILFAWLVGDRAGEIRRTRHGDLRHSDKCPSCGVPFATTITRQADPQGSLF